jgi:hypothetical protein
VSEPGPNDDRLIAALPGLARLYASALLRTAEWTVRQVLEIVDPQRGRERADAPAGDERDGGPEASAESLRRRGEELLRRSADVNYSEETHPAYERILSQLAPDEARILRLLALRGAQPAVDVRAGLPLVSSLVAAGRNMIGAEAGCRYVERVPSYLNNLYRLGLIWFSREPIAESLRYQVLEAQPDVLEALSEGGRTVRTVRRSIVLTPFGRDFCEIALPFEPAELEALTGERESTGVDEELAGLPDGEGPGGAEGDAA